MKIRKSNTSSRRQRHPPILRCHPLCIVLILASHASRTTHGFVAQQQQEKSHSILHRQSTFTRPSLMLQHDRQSTRRSRQDITSTTHPRYPPQRIQQQRPFAAHHSPLFAASSTTSQDSSTSTTTRKPSLLNTLWHTLQSNKKLWLIPTLAILLLPRWVAQSSVKSLTYILEETLPWKKVARVVLAVWICISIASTAVTNKRQAQDATSEWSRFAEKPGARGRAILWLMVQQAVLIVAARITATLRLRQTAKQMRQRAGHNFSNGLLKLGPLYIKLGQIVSCRKGLLGKEWIDAMADLQDRVPARTGQDALDLAYATLEGGKEEFDQLFVDFDSKPLAAASLGQVHRAKLRSNNDEVAVKVQRPFLRQIYDQDFVLLTTIAQFMDKLPGTSKNVGGVESSWTQIFVDAEDILYREIDYRDEAENAMRFANDFGLGLGGNATTPVAMARNNKTMPSAAEWLRTPYVYSDVSNERLLVMEFVPSIKITNREKLDANNVTEEERIELADNLARAYLIQFCCNMFFSTDPHPGNLGVELVPINQGAEGIVHNLDIVPDSLAPTRKPRLVMYDFGQAATLNRNQADGILEIIEAIVDTNVDRSIAAFQKMGVLVDGANLDEVRSKVSENYRTGKVKANRKKLRRKGYKFRDEDTADTSNATATSVQELSTTKTAAKTSDSKVMSYFSLPAEYAFVARAISQMDGVGKSLDPEFDFISSAAPYLVEVKGADLYVKEELEKFFKGLGEKINKFQMETLPNWWEDITKGRRKQ